MPTSQKKKIILLIAFSLIIFSSCAGTTRSKNSTAELYPPETFAGEDSRFIEIDGVKIHYKEYGEGENSLLLLHGMLGSLEGWRYIIPELSKNYRVVAYDRPAFGLTERPPVTGNFNPYTPEALERQALKLTKELGLGKPVLVGHSAGGNLALRLAIRHPDSFSGLVLISPGIYTEIPPAIIRGLMEIGLLESSGIDFIRSIPEHVDELLAQTYYRPELIDKDLRESYLIPTRIENWDRAFWDYLIVQDDSMLAGGIQGIELPVMIIQGVQDKVVPPSDNLRAVSMMKNASLLILPRCGHVAHEEKPQQTVAVINGFLGSQVF